MRWEQYRKTPDIYLQPCGYVDACTRTRTRTRTRAPQVRQSLIRVLSLSSSVWLMTLRQETDLILCGFSPQPPELSLNHRSSVWCHLQQIPNTWRRGKGFPHLLGPPDSGGQKWFTNRMVATIYAQWRSALPVGWVVCGLEAPSFLAFLLEGFTECAV